MRVFAFENPGGTLQMLSYDMPEDDLGRMMLKFGLDGLRYVEFRPEELPTREFRDAWRLDGDKIVVNMESAKAIRKSNINAQYKKIIAAGHSPNDAALQEAVNNTHTQIDAASTLAEIRGVFLLTTAEGS